MSQSPDPAEVPPRTTGEPSDEGSGELTNPDDAASSGIAADVADALSGLADSPVEEHPEVYDDIHRRLGDTLSGIDHL
ncbi:MAG: hypothetical protein M3400_09535 [Actinomycetota bacterium]|nr:hypothetical protein [Actinomycetota bacterium]MDQ3734221.1 hypothetical protein [Actinomycetota bacterium]